ncbi:S-layer homology domain-containing protein [Paenibacillus chondroitinus]|uniref:S-layer homology domain-containing protein n=1 Tax=Paenibacillus chondroitinus TaxID=59842 RepID=A0ABU6DDR8_9BACL|nr:MULTISPECIES: S-layer homology domain-containing protein [Paenibacillus]MCY9660482.1 S-layer homology domain-containing protein [Paenibacillus anseongense]MEB4795093.1 S-layer homology domain-containing protein [Paenibacillus chondroitinus]
MKKTLSVVLTSAMALSMFSSLAFAAKSSADFTDLKDLDAATKAKFDAMISAGIFDGVSETTFGLKDEMNRAQFAKVAALIMGLDVNKDLKTSSFTDVSVDDAANGYALPYIEALKTAGVTDGYAEGQYNPAGKVTKEQLATFLVRVLGQDEAAKGKTGTDATVSGWAQGYVALALELKLLSNGEDGTFGGMANATRDLLLTGAYEAKQQYVPAGKVSVTGAKATGAQQVTVTFNKPVDTDKATLSLKKGTSDVVTTTKFSDDKKSAVLTLTDVKVSNGEYTVTVSGLDAATVDKTTATFTGEDEVLTKIDFVNAGDTIAYADKTIVKVKASNQYGENATTNAGSYNVYTSAATFTKITKDTDGTLLITLDTANESTTQGVSVIPVTIVNNDSHITATKNFKLGTQPILTKLELGDARYSVGTTLNGKGENVKFDLNLFDQYGGTISYDSLMNAKVYSNGNTSTSKLFGDTTVIWNDYIPAEDVKTEVEDNGNDIPQVKISLLNDVDKAGDYNFTVFNQAATASGKVSIKSSKLANKVEIGEMNDVIAAGDTEVYIPVVAYDAAGNQLSMDDLTSDENIKRIQVNVSGVEGQTTASILDSGEHKGSIKLNQISNNTKGAVSITAIIATANASSTSTKTFTVADARVPDHFKVVTDPAKSIVKGGESDIELAVIDQYGQVLDDAHFTDSQGNNAPTFVDGSNNKYQVKVEVTATGTAAGTIGLKKGDDNNNAITSAIFGKGETAGDFKAFNDEYTLFTTEGATEGAKADYTATITKNGTEISKLTRTITVASATDDLTYSVNAVPTLFNFSDSGVVVGSTYGTDGTAISADDLKDVTKSQVFAQEVKLTAKNASGDTVKLPAGTITDIKTSNNAVAKVALVGGKAYVLGNKTGTATLNVTYRTIKGEIKTATVAVTSKNDALAVDKVEADSTMTVATTGGNAFINPDLIVTDNYGVEYEQEDAQKANGVLGVTFSANGYSANVSAVSIDANGNIQVTKTSDADGSFDLTITSPSGKSDVVAVTVTGTANNK